MLRQLYRSDGEVNLALLIRREVSNPIHPVTENGHLRPSTLLSIATAMIFLLVAVFLYFSVGGLR